MRLIKALIARPDMILVELSKRLASTTMRAFRLVFSVSDVFRCFAISTAVSTARLEGHLEGYHGARKIDARDRSHRA